MNTQFVDMMTETAKQNTLADSAHFTESACLRTSSQRALQPLLELYADKHLSHGKRSLACLAPALSTKLRFVESVAIDSIRSNVIRGF
jgi:hypothetical protein